MTVTLDSLKKSVGKKIGKSKIFAWVADLERASGNLDAALNVVNEGLFSNTNDVAGMIVRAKVLFQKENFDDCLTQCEKILLKDPFNLAALKIMGDAYDKLGNEAGRNLCYRQYHDMDPLNNFWKDEYDVPVEVAVAATAGALGEESFEMPSDESLDMNFGGDGLFDKSAEEDVVEEPAADESAEAQESQQAEPAASPFSSPFSSPFGSSIEKSAESQPQEEPAKETIFGNDFLGGMDDDAAPAEESSVEEDDPFAALAAMLPNSESADDSALEDLSASLDSALQSAEYGEKNEEFPVDDNISGTDVNSALSDIFGLDDDLEAEESSTPKIEDIVLDEEAEANASSIFSAPAPAAEDKPMSVDNAFDSIFGEDELPEEIEPAVAEPAAAAPVEEDKPTTVDNAFDSIFGEDELPEEKPATTSAADVFGNGLFEKSAGSEIFEKSFTEASEDLTFNEPAAEETVVEETQELPVEEEPVVEEPAVEEPAVAAPVEEDKPTTVDNAFDSIFGEDELPEEKPAVASVADMFGNSVFEKSFTEASEELTAVEPAAEESLELPAEDVSLELPAEEESLELPTAEESLELPADSLELPEEKSSDVADAFGSIFGDDDDLPEEKPVAEVETPVDPVIASPMDFVFGDDAKPAESAAEAVAEEAPVSESSLAIDSAFGSIFGDDDDLPVEKPTEAVAEAPAADLSLAEQVNSAETELEMPVAEEKSSDDLAMEMGGAFASMFGNDDELDLPEAKSSSVNDQESTSAAIEEVAATVSSEEAKSDLDKSFDGLFGNDDSFDLSRDLSKSSSPDLGALESEVSGAFKGLFDMEDDALDESMPSNKGVDFLMSGDSDDEVSASLINNPDAPLDRGAHELDESLNTRTLAEIYFDQGLYGKAIDIYTDLAQKEPNNAEIVARLDEIEKIYRSKFGGEA